MFDPTPEQAQLIGLVVFFLPLLVQGVRWLAAQVKVNLGTAWIRVLVGALAVVVLSLTALPVFDLPPADPAFSAVYIVAFLAWAEATFIVLAGFVTSAHLLYEYIWRRAFESNVPVLSSLASDKL